MWSSVDQQTKINSFVNGLQVGKVHHAYLVLGPQNSGKGFFAVKMAQAVNCTGTNPRVVLVFPVAKYGLEHIPMLR